MTVPDVVIILGVATTSVVTIINTVASHWGRKEITEKLNDAASDRKEVKTTLGQVQENTNGRITNLMNRVKELEEINKVLNGLVEKRGRFPGVIPSTEPRSNNNG